MEDPADPRYGQIDEIIINSPGQGYFGDTVVEFKGGLGNEAVFLNAIAEDIDGEIQSVEFISNGIVLAEDLTEPYALQNPFSVGYYEFIAIAKDDAGNSVASEPVRLNISTTRGAAPSGMIINPLPPMGISEYNSTGQGYFWTFVRDYSELIQQSEANFVSQNEDYSLTANSYVHLTSRATDGDGNISEVSFFLNNKFLGYAEKMHDSPHYVLPVDLSSFGEQPVYRIDTMIKDDSGNLVIPNNPITLNVLPASSSRPDISIVVPSPNATSIPVYAMGSPVLLGVDIFPKEGTLESVSLYANGRFIGDAQIQDEFEFGRKRYSLRWTAENPGRYHLTASVRDNLGTVVYTDTGVDVDIANSSGSLPPTVNLIFPLTDGDSPLSLTSTSTIRLEANASDPDGGLNKIQFFVNGEPYGQEHYANNNVSQSRITYGTNWTPGAPGNYLIYAVATDNSGNQVMSAAASVTSTTGDSQVPTVKMSYLNTKYTVGEEIIFSVDAKDSAFSYSSGEYSRGYVEEVMFFVNGVQISVDESQPYYGSWIPLEEGQYVIYALARDNQGNIGISQVQTVIVESETLRLEMFLNSEGTFYDGTPFTLDLNIFGKSEDLDDLLNQRVQSTVKLYVNGAYYNDNMGGIPTQLYDNNGDLLSLGYKLNYTTSYANDADYNGSVTLSGVLSDNTNIYAVSNVILINIVPPTPWVNPDSNLLNLRQIYWGGRI